MGIFVSNKGNKNLIAIVVHICPISVNPKYFAFLFGLVSGTSVSLILAPDIVSLKNIQ